MIEPLPVLGRHEDMLQENPVFMLREQYRTAADAQLDKIEKQLIKQSAARRERARKRTAISLLFILIAGFAAYYWMTGHGVFLR